MFYSSAYRLVAYMLLFFHLSLYFLQNSVCTNPHLGWEVYEVYVLHMTPQGERINSYFF